MKRFRVLLLEEAEGQLDQIARWSYIGPVAVDLQPLAAILIDLKPGMMHNLRSEQEGVGEVVEELKQNVSALGAKAAISPDVYAHFVACTENLDKIRPARALIEKLAEILEESEAYYEHEREADISIIADAVRSAARRKNDAVRASFEKTLKYNSQSAEKAVKTRRKNAQAAAQGQAGEPAKPSVEPASTP
jgi:GTPase SAR1 family protein